MMKTESPEANENDKDIFEREIYTTQDLLKMIFTPAGSGGYLSTYIPELDHIGIARKGELTLLAGRSQSGKSSLLYNILRNVCYKDGVHVGIISIDHNVHDIMSSIATIHAGEDIVHYRNNSDSEYSDHMDFVSEMSLDDIKKFKLSILPCSSFPFSYSRCHESALRLKSERDIDILIIDHILPIYISDGSQSSAQAITDAMHAFRSMARELGVSLFLSIQIPEETDNGISGQLLLDCLCKTADTTLLLLRDSPSDEEGKMAMFVSGKRTSIERLYLNYSPKTGRCSSSINEEVWLGWNEKYTQSYEEERRAREIENATKAKDLAESLLEKFAGQELLVREIQKAHNTSVSRAFYEQALLHLEKEGSVTVRTTKKRRRNRFLEHYYVFFKHA
ncbi:MAG: hypothetical protein LIQ31_05515 [Planctomycetes bacterium]|nr:hypothetical protein [Planctomycetota bacterium]